MIVLMLTVSPNHRVVPIAKVTIPHPNPINLPGHNNPSNPLTICLVAFRYMNDRGMPINIIAH